MNGVDTNVLLRFLVADDVMQHQKVTDLFASRLPGEKIRISNIVLIEVVWVLRSVYQQTENKIVEGLEILLAIPSFEIEGRATLESVTDKRLPLSLLADGLIAESNSAAKCMSTYTFDKLAAARISSMELL